MSEETSPAKRGGAQRGAARTVHPAVNSHIRVSGIVRIGARYAMLEAADGTVWRLRSEEDLSVHAEQRVTAEARVSAVDELIVLWIGPEGVAEAGSATD